MRCSAVIGVLLCFVNTLSADDALPKKAADLYRQALADGRFAREFKEHRADIQATADGRSFWVRVTPDERPTHWIVSLHGAGQPARGFATDDSEVWRPHLKGRRIGLLCLQWWLGTGDRISDFLTPLEMHREIESRLAAEKVEPGRGMLHGFSRGAANIYAVAALDHGKGKRSFSLIVASSGGVALDYPPTKALLRGEYGEEPLKGTRWITAAGARDANPQRDGIAGMRRTTEWLKEQGAEVVESIEDPNFGHGALHLNGKNIAHVLDVFTK